MDGLVVAGVAFLLGYGISRFFHFGSSLDPLIELERLKREMASLSDEEKATRLKQHQLDVQRKQDKAALITGTVFAVLAVLAWYGLIDAVQPGDAPDPRTPF